MTAAELDMLFKGFEQLSLGVAGWGLFYFATKMWLKKQAEHEEFLDTEIKELKAKLNEDEEKS